MPLNLFTGFHVLLSLTGIVSGFVVLSGFFTSKRFEGWTTLFLVTTAATSVTGFLFPFHGFMLSYAVGILSLVVLALAVRARRRFQLTGDWRRTYVITSVVALYFNAFVLVAQIYQKIPALKELAPTLFRVDQGGVLLLFVVLARGAVIKFHPAMASIKASRAGA